MLADGLIDERREPDAGSAAGERNDQALGDQLPDEPTPARADREPDRDFLAALGGAREEEIGEIHAGQEKHQPADREQDAGEAEDGVADFGQKQAGLA